VHLIGQPAHVEAALRRGQQKRNDTAEQLKASGIQPEANPEVTQRCLCALGSCCHCRRAGRASGGMNS